MELVVVVVEAVSMEVMVEEQGGCEKDCCVCEWVRAVAVARLWELWVLWLLFLMLDDGWSGYGVSVMTLISFHFFPVYALAICLYTQLFSRLLNLLDQ